jgi:hypothetical protein
MSVKQLQITLIIAAVLGAIGIAAMLGGRGATMPEDFRPPGWVSSLQQLTSTSSVNRREVVTSTRRAFPPVLVLSGLQPVNFRVLPDPDTPVRELEFQVLQGKVVIRYDSAELRQTQEWPDRDYPNAAPRFVVQESGGALTITPKTRNVRLRIK